MVSVVGGGVVLRKGGFSAQNLFRGTSTIWFPPRGLSVSALGAYGPSVFLFFDRMIDRGGIGRQEVASGSSATTVVGGALGPGVCMSL